MTHFTNITCNSKRKKKIGPAGSNGENIECVASCWCLKVTCFIQCNLFFLKFLYIIKIIMFELSVVICDGAILLGFNNNEIGDKCFCGKKYQ